MWKGVVTEHQLKQAGNLVHARARLDQHLHVAYPILKQPNERLDFVGETSELDDGELALVRKFSECLPEFTQKNELPPKQGA